MMYCLKFLYQTKQTTTELLSIMIGMKLQQKSYSNGCWGGRFPESTAKFIERTIPIRKIGDTFSSYWGIWRGFDAANAELNRFLDINVNTLLMLKSLTDLVQVKL
jgi:hypothetical protein